MTPFDRLRNASHDLEGDLLRTALVAMHWSLLGAAKALETPYASIQRIIARHPEILEEYRKHRKGDEDE